MIDQVVVDAILGALVVPFVDYVTKNVNNSKIEFLIAFVSSVVLGAVVAIAEGKIQKGSFDSAYSDLITVFTASQVIYTLYWKNSLARENFSQRISPTTIEPEAPVAETGEPAQTSPAQ